MKIINDFMRGTTASVPKTKRNVLNYTILAIACKYCGEYGSELTLA